MKPSNIPKLTWTVIFLITLILILIWTLMTPLSVRFSDFSSSMRSLGQITGLVGMVLFSLTLILSTRIRLLEELFGGLDKVYRAHHFLGASAFVLLLFHPVFLALRFILFSLKAAASSFLPINGFAVNVGIFSLATMILFLTFTFIIKIPYHYWKITHQFLGISYLFAVLHVIFIRSDISNSMGLRVYVFFFMILGIGAYLYRPLLARFIVSRAKYRVRSVKALNGSVVDISLEPESADEKILHCPGQFIYVSFRQKGISSESHPFTISSGNEMKVTIKSLGDFTSDIKNLKQGALALIEGPYGKFCPSSYGKKQIWIAGGIGITPFLSIAEHLEKNNLSADLFYSAKDRNDAIFLDKLENISKNNKNLRIFPYFTSEKGRLNTEFIMKNSDIKDKEIFICGPAPMMNQFRKEFIRAGIKKEKIHMEEFQMI